MKKDFDSMTHRCSFSFKTVIGVLVLSAATNAFAAQEKTPTPVTPVPVSKDMLDGTRLMLKTPGVSVDLPGSGWSWMTYESSGKNFLSVNGKTFEMYAVGVGELKHEMVDHQPQSLIASAKKTLESRGGKIEGDTFSFIETPGFKKSAKITFTEVEKSKKKFVCVYLFQTAELTLIKIQSSTPGASAEPEAFKSMVKSVKLLKPVPAPVPPK